MIEIGVSSYFVVANAARIMQATIKRIASGRQQGPLSKTVIPPHELDSSNINIDIEKKNHNS